jgi:hypothetical protein
MKKIVLSFLGLFAAFAVGAQTPQFVSTEPANKNVIIEEYTGINCGFCPAGHRIVREYEEENPGRVFGINIHQGPFAAGTYITQWGDALANQTGLEGYPAGTVNRHVFSGGVTALSRGEFVQRGNQILSQTSFVNVAAQATIDLETRELIVNVEAYYTADAETSSNKLNVVLLQDNIIGQQQGASANPAQVTADGQYIHMSMLRDMLTGQWGDDITAPEGSTVIPAGTLVQRTYTYDVPTSISNELVELLRLRLIVFVTKDQQEIYTGSECIPQFLNLPQLEASSKSIRVAGIKGCNDLATLTMKVYNTGANALTNMQISYGTSVSEAQIFDWTGNIPSCQEVDIELPNVEINVGQNTNVFANIVSINGTPIEDAQKTATIKKDAPKEGNGDKLKIIIKTDEYAYECSWKLSDGNGNVLAEEDYYPQQAVVRDTVIVPLTETGCYVFEIFDEYGDGGTTYKIYDGSEKRLVNGTGSSYGDYKAVDMKILSLVGLEEAEGAILQTLAYPNPVNDMLNLEISMLESTHANISVVDMLGREVISLGEVSLATGNNKFEINTSNLSNGAYFVKIISNSGITSKKISVNR